MSKFSPTDPFCIVECPKAYCRDEVTGQAVPSASDDNPQSPPSGSPGGLGTPALAGIVAGAVLLVVLSGTLVFCWCRRRRRRRRRRLLLDEPGRGSAHGVSGKPELEGSPGYGSAPGAVAGALALKPELMEVERPHELGEDDNGENLPNSGRVYELEQNERAVIHRTQGQAAMDTSSGKSSRRSQTRSERSSQRHLRFSAPGQERDVGRNGSQRSQERLLRIQEIEEVSRRLTEELQRLNKGRSGTRPESS